ncbi:hypothetical protein ACRE_060260 [Hapsidospora chrysogenum ATCC 11550]|uniref:Uncharacterized protein n=1 Tax=Hapsidospora chrysogenum (strain ATCC 11550 / CBS 779.69 / DSM 880 / IAM 14645 / JCM 23072 / IMI 49137) TaxID=857340 RepID=A0A086T1I4_HAPC1|nr:hypothetical protein ACRE_060260 [Hapsidospora chrysogenum ATCC 11550]
MSSFHNVIPTKMRATAVQNWDGRATMRLEPRQSRDGRHGKQTTSQRRPTRKGEHPCRRPPARPGMASAAVHADLRSSG